MSWTPADFLREHLQLNGRVANSVVDLFEHENTVPFIARYRKDVTGGLDAAEVRQAKEKWEQAKNILARIQSVKNQLESRNQLTAALNRSLCQSRTLDDVEMIYAPFKPTGVKTLAGRARAAGLEQPCLDILAGGIVDLKKFVGKDKQGVSTFAQVESAFVNLLADLIFHNKDVRDFVATSLEDRNIKLQSARSASSTKLDSEKPAKRATTKAGSNAVVLKPDANRKNNSKPANNAHIYEKYFEFSMPAVFVKNYAVSAINRGEANKILTVKVSLPDYFGTRIKQRIGVIMGRSVHQSHVQLFEKAMEDCFNRLIKPYIQRYVRSRLTQNAHQEAIDMFARNLKQLLLTPPLKGEVILGIDPGYWHGCKVAVISRSGSVLATRVVYLPQDVKNTGQIEAFKTALKDMILKHNCAKIAIGNGSGCRKSEELVSDLIGSGALRPLLPKTVGYVIVNESGSSVYSASELAAKELPDLDEKLRSAVSIARRVQDPISELVKIDPKSLGVGQYQHDVKEKALQKALDAVVEECVSFVGVDVNTCSEHLLRYVAGMNVTRAKKVIEFREKLSKTKGNGIVNREQLTEISGIGAKVFEQAAGFIRIFPDTLTTASGSSGGVSCDSVNGPQNPGKIKKPTEKVKLGKRKAPSSLDHELLDSTIVHPESYTIAEDLLDRLEFSKSQLGDAGIRTKWDQYLQTNSSENISAEFNGCSREKLDSIIEALSQPKHADFRDSFEKPYFRQTIRSLADLRVGQTLPGVVRNVTGFGAFVDVGVGDDGLVPLRFMNNDITALAVGQNVMVEVMSMELERQRYALKWRSDL